MVRYLKKNMWNECIDRVKKIKNLQTRVDSQSKIGSTYYVGTY
jgi:hypothetical protein